MRREALRKSVKRIINDLLQCSIPEVLEEAREVFRVNRKEGPERHSFLPLQVFQRYVIATHDYDDVEKQVCSILGIEDLLEVHFWEYLARADEPKGIFEMASKVRFTVEHLPRVLSLVGQEYVDEIKEESPNLPEDLKGKTILSVLVVEDEKQFSSPARLTRALESISNLYSVVATLDGEAESDLIVLACDSGSDKSFDFLGLAKLTEQVKEIIISIWDRRVFHRQRHVSESLTLIAESLPILEKIEQLREQGAIEREQAELLKRKTITGATQFIEAGITIPELEGVSSHSPKQLMKPEPKLLVSPWNDAGPKNHTDIQEEAAEAEHIDEDDEELSEAEVELLDKLLKKNKKKNKKHNK